MMMMSHRLRALSLVLALAASGCISVPDEVEADFSQPDGKRPNNFGRIVETPQGPTVKPDVPTVPSADKAPRGS